MSSRHSVRLLALVTIFLAGPALAHRERPFPDFGPMGGFVPDLNRKNPNTLVVCKPSSKPTKAEHADIHSRLPDSAAEEAAWHRNAKLFRKCRYEHIQDAVNAAGNDTTILVMPGIYREEPSRAAPSTSSGDNPDGTYSFAWHLAHPNDANLVGIIGKRNITLEGTGDDPRDVLVDAGFVKDVVIRADRANGIIVRNLWARDANEHGIYIVETSGYVFDRTVGSYSKEYELFSFASDNGLYTDCEAEGGSDSGIYIGGSPDTHLFNRFSATVQRCKMHDNALGFSGTQGNSVHMIDNDIYDNAIGLSWDSEIDHPNFPERWCVIEGNRLYDNNLDVYAAGVGTPAGGPAYSFFRYPVGTGMWIIGGEHNVIRDNWFWNNGRFGIIFFFNPFEDHPVYGIATPRHNEISGNYFGVDPDANVAPNLYNFPPGGLYAPGGSDIFWDENGEGNCVGPQAAGSGPITIDPPGYPACPNSAPGPGIPLSKINLLLACTLDEVPPGSGNFVTHDKDLFDAPYPCPFGHENFSGYQNRDEKECGNSAIDAGEDCDGGYGGGGTGESCESLGLGPDDTGPLACDGSCIYDTSGCTAPTCGRVREATLSIRNQPKPGADRLAITLRGLDGAGRTFDPSTEGIEVTVRDDTRIVHQTSSPSALHYQGNVPAGPAWSATANRYLYVDRTGASDHIIKVDLTAAAGFGGTFDAVVRVRDLDLPAELLTQRTGTVIVRIGNDCWTATTSCQGKGQSAGCRKKSPQL